MDNKKKFAKAKELVAGGMSVRDACEKVGLVKSMYSYYLKAGRPKASKIIAIPEATPGQLLAFYGSPEQIAQVARSLQ